MKRLKLYFSITFLSLICFTILSTSLLIPKTAQALPDILKPNCTSEKCEYTFLAPVNALGLGDSKTYDVAGKEGTNRYLQGLYTFGIVIASGLAVLMIVLGGAQYASSDAIQGKSDAKGKITAAISGLILALLSYTILNTINPTLVNVNFAPAPIRVNTSGNTPAVTPVTEGNASSTTGTVTNGTGGPTAANQGLSADQAQHVKTLAVNGGLTNLSPSDAARFFPGGNTSNPDNWVAFVSAIAKLESGFDPNQTYTENFNDSSGNRVISTGLLQISQESARAYGFPGITTEDLKNPQKNLEVGAAILKKWIAQDGCISCIDSTTGDPRGGARYWAVLRGDKANEIAKSLTGN